MKKINNLFLMTIANTGGSGITAVFWFIIAALLVPSEYGEIQYLIAMAGLGYTISRIGTSEVISVYTAKKNTVTINFNFALLNCGNYFRFNITIFVFKSRC